MMQTKSNRTTGHPEDAVIYIRVATRNDSSAAEQEAAARAYCATQGMTVGAVFRDEGVSGLTRFADRAGGKALLVAVKAGSMRHLVTQDYTRISRDATAVEGLGRVLNEAGVKLHLVSIMGPVSELPSFIFTDPAAKPSKAT